MGYVAWQKPDLFYGMFLFLPHVYPNESKFNPSKSWGKADSVMECGYCTSSNYVAYTNKPFFSNLTKSNNRFMNIGAHDNSIYYYLLYNCYQNVLRYNPLPDRVLYGNSKDYHLGVNNTTSVPAMPLIILCVFSPCLYSIQEVLYIRQSIHVRLLHPLLTASLSEILPAIKSVTDLSIKTTKAEIHELIERCHTKRKPILITLSGIRWYTQQGAAHLPVYDRV